ncbi:flagellar assembly protein FliW [Oscillospiraceae bacterium CM]|nr:flagellar assembly protein FliW [Oscillospiraceae bacterium CM]
MIIPTAHFGDVEIDDNKILHFDKGLPGLDEDRRFALLSNEDSRPVSWLQSLDHKEISLPVMDPFLICPDYSFDISQDDVEVLAIEDIKDVYVLSILVIPKNANAMTINLSAPIIVNVRNSRGCQIVLDDRKYRVRVPVSDLLAKSGKDGMELC